MEQNENEIKKFIYIDNDLTKVVKGRILKEDEFTYKIQCTVTEDVIVLGKRAIVKVYGVQ